MRAAACIPLLYHEGDGTSMKQDAEVGLPEALTSTTPWNTLRLWLQQMSWGAVARFLARLFVLTLVALFSVRAAPDAAQERNRAIAMEVVGYEFHLVGWEAQALREKADALLRQPARGIPLDQGAVRVVAYLERAHWIANTEWEINRLLSLSGQTTTPESRQLQERLDLLRNVQARERPVVEQLIQKQVSQELVAAGLGVAGQPVPPVLFTFTEPPRKLIVSPRTRIAQIYGQMLVPQMTLEEVEDREEAIYRELNLSAYITRIGGLGAFPTMVIDRGSLPWIMSTVAHEWTHNYLSMFPLGLLYGSSPELTALNESVAEIVGDEIGRRVVRRYYPAFLPPEEEPGKEKPEKAPGEKEAQEAGQEEVFDFDAEMRKTRLEVDRLLNLGLVKTAEVYMEQRRQLFVAHGYYIRKLNQAYFAFHGSYGDTPFGPSPLSPEPPIGARVTDLWKRTGDLAAFLHTVRWFTGPEDLDRTLGRPVALQEQAQALERLPMTLPAQAR